MYDSLTSVLEQTSVSPAVERRHLPITRISTSVERNPVSTSSNMFTISVPAYPPKSRNWPSNLSLRFAPIPANTFLLIGIRAPDSDKSSQFGSYAIIFRACARLDVSILMVEEVAD